MGELWVVKKIKAVFAVIVAYAIMQFAWWAIYLVELRGNIRLLELTMATDENQRALIERTYRSKMLMIGAEGAVFLIILLTAIWFVYRGIKRQEADLRLKNNFLLSVSHELKTPLSVVKLFQQTFLKRPDETELLKPMAASALTETRRLEDLVEKILFAASLEGNSRFALHEEVSLQEMLQSVHREFAPRRQSGEFKLQLDSDAIVPANEAYLRFAVNNLVENAFKYAPEGDIILKLSEKSEAPTIEVIDHGQGIAPADIERIFDKFYRAGNEMVRQTKGTGLGLYLTKVIVRMHNAELSVQSTQGKGSTFAIAFKKRTS